MNTLQIPGTGDYESSKPTSPLDPRIFDDADNTDDRSLDTIAKIRDFADMAEVAHKNGDNGKALRCIDEIRCICDEVLG